MPRSSRSLRSASLDLMKLCREHGVLYIDTVVEPWAGFYFDHSADPAERSNYMLRETVRAERRANPGGTTAVSCCGANPGMVSWLVKAALLNIATDTGVTVDYDCSNACSPLPDEVFAKCNVPLPPPPSSSGSQGSTSSSSGGP